MSSGSDSGGDGKRRKGRRHDDGALLKEIKSLMQQSEERTFEKFESKIDALSDKLTKRLDSTERDVKKLGRNVKEFKGDLINLTERINKDKEDLPTIVNQIVIEQLAAAPAAATSTPNTPTAITSTEDQKASKYYKARKSLRIWPLPDLADLKIRDFLASKLGLDNMADFSFTAKRLASARANDPPHQALITFENSRQRDIIKSAASKLTDREVGIQMDPPDHLRSHYQTFQALAYQLKLKHPKLKRNVKFCDAELDLEMDFNLGDGRWRTISITDAREALKEARSKPRGRIWLTCLLMVMLL